jgi:hypothetical protein
VLVVNEKCPRCGTSEYVKPKMIMVSDYDPRYIPGPYPFLAAASIQALKDEVVPPAPLEQFISGCYCSKCSCGFLPDEYGKSLAEIFNW